MKKEAADQPVTLAQLREVIREERLVSDEKLRETLKEERIITDEKLRNVFREERLVTQQQFHEERAYTTALIQQSTALVVEKVDRIKTMLEDDHRDLAETVETHTKQIAILNRDVAALKH